MRSLPKSLAFTALTVLMSTLAIIALAPALQ